MVGWAIGVAGLAWVIGATVLGFDWQGHEHSPGVWADGVSLAQWAACWALLAMLAAATARLLSGWSVRLLTLLPLVGWIVWQLRGNALGPIPMVIYIVPTFLAWCAGLAIADGIRKRLARSM